MLKVISWNMGHRTDAWRAIADSEADVALVQEASEPPADIASRLDVDDVPWFTAGAGLRRPWRTAVVGVSKRVRLERIAALSIADAAPGELAISRLGTVAAAHVEDPDTGARYTLISMYAAWENPHGSVKSAWIYADASVHRVISDISALVGQEDGHRIIASGDFDILHGYGENGSRYWSTRYRTVFDRFQAIGLQFVGPQPCFRCLSIRESASRAVLDGEFRRCSR